MEIGHIIRRIRDQKGFSQKQIADELGMTQANYNKIENDKGKPRIETLEKLAKFYGIKIADFFGEEKKAHIINENISNNERVDVGTIIYEAETDIKQERLLWIQLLASKDEQIIQLKDANELLKTMLEHHR